MPKRRPGLGPDRRRALQVLAGSPDGTTEAVMLAHGFTVALLAELVRDGLTTAHEDRIRAGGRMMQVTRVAGRQVLAGSRK
jgi:hypothetical protein